MSHVHCSSENFPLFRRDRKRPISDGLLNAVLVPSFEFCIRRARLRKMRLPRSASIQFSGICIAELSTVQLCFPLCRNDQFYVLLSNFIVINTNQTAAAPRPVFSKFRLLETAGIRKASLISRLIHGNTHPMHYNAFVLKRGQIEKLCHQTWLWRGRQGRRVCPRRKTLSSGRGGNVGERRKAVLSAEHLRRMSRWGRKGAEEQLRFGHRVRRYHQLCTAPLHQIGTCRKIATVS